MSKFLGPVHFWLYRKIQFQESLIDALISYAVQQGWNDDDLTRYSCQDRRQLDEIIDETNGRVSYQCNDTSQCLERLNAKGREA